MANRDIILRNMINKAYDEALSATMKMYQKTGGTKRVVDSDMKKIIGNAIAAYKIGIMEALKLHGDLDDVKEK